VRNNLSRCAYVGGLSRFISRAGGPREGRRERGFTGRPLQTRAVILSRHVCVIILSMAEAGEMRAAMVTSMQCADVGTW
jgi:hypothetical protein